MGVFYFPCNFVYWRKVPNHEKYKKRILDYIKNNKSNFYGDHGLIYNGITTYQSNVEGDEFNSEFILNNPDVIKGVVWDSLDEVLHTLNSRENFKKCNIQSSLIVNGWLSQYDKNSSVDLHEHFKTTAIKKDEVCWESSFVLVYIINDPNEKNTTVFVEPYMRGISLNGMQENKFDTGDIDEIGEGTVLIFPSNLHHKVKTMEKPGRMIFSFNICSEIIK